MAASIAKTGSYATGFALFGAVGALCLLVLAVSGRTELPLQVAPPPVPAR